MADAKTQFEPADTNMDGRVSDAELLSWQKSGGKNVRQADTAAYYGFAAALIAADEGPDGTHTLAPFFQWVNTYIKKNGRRPTDYELDNQRKKLGPQSWWQKWDANQQAAMQAEASDPASFKASVEKHATDIRAAADDMGVPLDEAMVNSLARLSRINNWSANETKAALAPYLKTALEKGQGVGGNAGYAQAQLTEWAKKNGVNLSSQMSAKLVGEFATGKKSLEQAQSEIRKMYMAGMYPAWADKINAGYDPVDIFRPHLDNAQQLLENPSIDLNDPIMKRITQAVGDDGKPVAVPLYEAERMIRQDPRWQKTNNAYQTYSSVADDILRMFGFR